jgi:hypothetical protein
MRLAIMQPYLFPYIGYFQLMAAVDRFVVYDDVAFIKGGWINRNCLRQGGQRQLFTLPLKGASPNRRIADTRIDLPQLPHWLAGFRRTLAQNYGRAPHFERVQALVDDVFEPPWPTSIATLNLRALRCVAGYLGIDTDIVDSSAGYGNRDLSGQDRVIDICRREGARTYANAIGGRELYDAAAFARHGVALRFLKTGDLRYAQGRGAFVPSLSILDVLMHCDPVVCRTELLQHYEWVEARPTVAA